MSQAQSARQAQSVRSTGMQAQAAQPAGVQAQSVSSAQPAGVAAQDEQGARVQGVFRRIARRYELFNALSSLGIYRIWLYRMARLANCRPTDRVIDTAGGTGDVTFQLCRTCPPASVELTDFTAEMLDVARAHIQAGASRGVEVRTTVADAQDLPFADDSFDVYTVAYGLRNFSDRVKSMQEARRVLHRGGTYVALEFSTPTNPVWRAIYNVYLGHIIPALGGALTRDRAGFDYLVSSIRAFPPQEQVGAELRASGFTDVEYHLCTGGIATLYKAVAR